MYQQHLVQIHESNSTFILARLLFLRTVDVNNTERGLLRTSLLSESIEERINVSLKELISSSVKLNSSLTEREILLFLTLLFTLTLLTELTFTYLEFNVHDVVCVRTFSALRNFLTESLVSFSSPNLQYHAYRPFHESAKTQCPLYTSHLYRDSMLLFNNHLPSILKLIPLMCR